MPLLLICGKPGTGKTTRANQIISFYKEKHPEIETKLINAEGFGINKELMYESFAKEKELRAFFRSNVDKELTKDKLVVVDSLNYIKGFRYELFCFSRTAKSTHCVLYCDNDLESCKEQNLMQTDPKMKFSEALLLDLASRMEVPNSNSRWDSPLYTVWPHEDLPIEAIHGSLFKEAKKMKDPISTKMEIKLDEDYAYKVDQNLNDLVKEVNKKLMQNKQFLKRKVISVQKGKTKVEISAKMSLGDLKKAKNGFIQMNKNNPIRDFNTLSQAFLYFLQSRG